MLTTLAAVLMSALLMFAVMIGGIWWCQERIAYQPPARWPPTPDTVRRIEYTATDGQRLFAFVLEPEVSPEGVLLAFHGNADLAVWQIPWAREVTRRTGWYVVLAEYRGYGGLGGVPSYDNIREDARAGWLAALRIAERLDIQPRSALFGHSLGSAVATELAAEIAHVARDTSREHDISHGTISALLLQSPFTSVSDMARIVSTRPVQVVWRVISRVHYDTRERVSELQTRLSISHGARDWLVPVAMGRELFTRARVPGQLLVVEDAGHNDVAEIGGEAYWQWLADALTERPETCLEARLTHRTERLD
jgi:fermentation-respiration switch protein FrsA (DUF1100 family)